LPPPCALIASPSPFGILTYMRAPSERTTFSQEDLYAFAASTPSVTAQKLLLNSSNPQIPPNLARNKQLHPEIWEALYSSGDYVVKAFLISNASTTQQAARVLDSIEYSHLALKLGVPKMSSSVKEQLLLSPKLTVEHAAGLLLHGVVTPDQASRFWNMVLTHRNLGHPSMAAATYLEVLTAVLTHYGALVSDEQLLDWIKHSPSILPTSIPGLLDCRPSVIPELLRTDNIQGAHRAAATCRHLTEEQGRRLLKLLRKDSTPLIGKALAAVTLSANPSLPYSLRAEALTFAIEANEKSPRTAGLFATTYSRPTVLENALARCSNRAATGAEHVTTPWHEITPNQLREITDIQEAFTALNVDYYPTMKQHHVVTSYQPLASINASFSEVFQVPTLEIDAAGPAAWENFLALLPGWTSSIKDLAEVSLSAVK